MNSNGKLIVLEGLDGSGKSTQFEILYDVLKEKGRAVKKISFPDYSDRSSELVKMYLAGEFSKNAADVNAYAASTFYAADRYASYMRYWKNDYKSGIDILAARYTTSNCIYQMTKLEKCNWDEYLSWLEDYEYTRLELPKPDLVIFLDMPVEISQKLMSDRYNGDESKKDIHESNVAFLNSCREAALYTAQRQGWKIVKCSEGDSPRSIEKISEEILRIIESI